MPRCFKPSDRKVFFSNLLEGSKKKLYPNYCKRCVVDGFKYPATQATIGWPGKSASSCRKHKEDGMVTSSTSNLCKECVRLDVPKKLEAGYGIPGGRSTSCKNHSTSDMVLLKGSAHCSTPGCTGTKRWGPQNGKPECCRTCALKKSGVVMIDHHARLCVKCNVKYVNSALPGQRKLTHCRTCGREEGCVAPEYAKCSKCKGPIAEYRDPKNPKTKYCRACMDPATMSHSRKKCVKCDIISPSFGFSETPTHCLKCALQGMSNVRKSRCKHPECKKFPYFGVDKTATHCREHAAGVPGMKDVSKSYCDDASHEATGHIGASFGVVGSRACRCAAHVTRGMVSNPMMRCVEEGCTEHGTYQGANSKDVRFCIIHAPDTAVSLAASACALCCLDDILGADGLCRTCSGAGPSKREEDHVRDLLVTEGFDFAHNRAIQGNTCILDRPDFFLDRGTFAVVLEVDEHQHNRGSYLQECELARMRNIAQAAGVPVTFIRYNPDKYRLADGRPGTANRALRQDTLIACLRAALETPPQDTGAFLRAAYLFYDGNDQSYVTLTAMGG